MSIVEMRVPTIGESINEVTLSQWLKADGAIINMDEPICEFESDKATLEFPAEAAGKLIYVAGEGDDLKIGDLVAKIDTSFA
ncbi:MAG TPA: lipoyl domain-containing protein, partial [Saprospiraceae bacterium]|nr:lipoyl domain-containing protein [Saprospiraceae bacterium]